AAALARLGKGAEAEEAYRQAVADGQRLVHDCPALPGCREDLAFSLNAQADHLAAMGKTADAERAYRESLATANTVLVQFPNHLPEYEWFSVQRTMKFACTHLRDLLNKAGRPQEADAVLGQVVCTLREHAARFPDEKGHTNQWAASSYAL